METLRKVPGTGATTLLLLAGCVLGAAAGLLLLPRPAQAPQVAEPSADALPEDSSAFSRARAEEDLGRTEARLPPGGPAAGPAPFSHGALPPEHEPPPRPGTERAWYEAFLRLGREGTRGLHALGEEVLGGDGPAARQVAYLRAAADAGLSSWPDLFARAIATLPHAGGPHGGSVPSFAVRYLSRRAAVDPRARAVLEEVAFRMGERVPPALRRRAAARLAETGTEGDLVRLLGHLQPPSDPLLEAGLLEALGRHPDQEAVVRSLQWYGRPGVPQNGTRNENTETER